MKQMIRRFLVWFSALFLLNIIVNVIFKSSLHLTTAFSTALGVSAGIVIVGKWVESRLS
ncbi:hypothetical protein [Oceanobacillus profundus]|nr:hypothetical protein [Oceanobacillus profundus]MBR3118955.1 hypothetical protein [Oceanobacillus sp.]MCM3399800.1 hypothetical protein [Oceanobacillus profundus]MDO6449949.1 hypothetical protein [Oceanobacillus profundus]